MLQGIDLKKRLSSGKPLNFQESMELIVLLAGTEATLEDRVEFLSYMHERGETDEELAGFASGIRKLSSLSKIPGTMDIVGTGGDRKDTINVSTCSAIVCASLGVKVAKHGNHAVTGTLGSADFLAKLGYTFEFSQEEAESRIKETNFLYILAGVHNSAFSKFKDARKQLKHETLFNLLGPITNPCDPEILVIGCTNLRYLSIYEKILQRLGKKGIVISSADGMDEISPEMQTTLSLVNGDIKRHEIDSRQTFGFSFETENIARHSAEEIFDLTLNSIKGEDARGSRFIAANAAPALYLSGNAPDLRGGYELALNAIKTKRAYTLMNEVVSDEGQAKLGEIHG